MTTTRPQPHPESSGLGTPRHLFALAERAHDRFLDSLGGEPTHAQVVQAHLDAWDSLDEVMVSATRTCVDVAPWIDRAAMLGWAEAVTSLLDACHYGAALRSVAPRALATVRRVCVRFRDDTASFRVAFEVSVSTLLAVLGRLPEARGHIEGVLAAFPSVDTYWSASEIYLWAGHEPSESELLRARDHLLEGLAYGGEMETSFVRRLGEVNRWLAERRRQAG